MIFEAAFQLVSGCHYVTFYNKPAKCLVFARVSIESLFMESHGCLLLFVVTVT
jgi:hypothetical protein